MALALRAALTIFGVTLKLQDNKLIIINNSYNNNNNNDDIF